MDKVKSIQEAKDWFIKNKTKQVMGEKIMKQDGYTDIKFWQYINSITEAILFFELETTEETKLKNYRKELTKR